KKNSGRTTYESLWEPMLKIKFGDYAERVPLSWMAGRMKQRLSSRKSPGGQETLGYLDGSLRTLLIVLEEKLRALNVALRTSTAVEEILFENGRVIGVRSGKDIYHADEVLFTTPTPVLAKLMQPIDQNYAQALGRVEYFGALCVVVESTRA